MNHPHLCSNNSSWVQFQIPVIQEDKINYKYPIRPHYILKKPMIYHPQIDLIAGYPLRHWLFAVPYRTVFHDALCSRHPDHRKYKIKYFLCEPIQDRFRHGLLM